mmetsp:Transcript_19941/g.41825  ORF Transcript_19941/g.41825 Transcript_19941/m.41825 type:complete len:102 (-) Transcript_19941:6-311(-)
MVCLEQNRGILSCCKQNGVAAGMSFREGGDVEDLRVDGAPCRAGSVVGCELGFGDGFEGGGGGDGGADRGLDMGFGGGDVAVAHVYCSCYALESRLRLSRQ